ncbi:hypothetical protein PAAG_06712 [Paracoccidioides lutzii Pb01]|uniref:non-specific serine/threonine protein kinase n=1 Tax=Paracoccidioides lutzii (strain ATCC MYA-826 / Pb01) TaxID=502779 RepID=C1H7H1_PARBA|nr:hypothetical protein PAAG_06712 [Paracoccidioides lutzii Pb01]EEH35665.2 hypothetical protein PAAG_06712 [Paracoccidioides lutzii Pb01]
MTFYQLLSPLTFPSSGFDLTDVSEKIEEESPPTYKAEKYYPARIGEIFNDRYQIVGRLGYGVTSTLWLCLRNKSNMLSSLSREPRHVALKLCVSYSNPNHEIRIYSHPNSVQSQSDHPGKNLFRKLYDSFEVIGPDGTHVCSTFGLPGLSLYSLERLAEDFEVENKKGYLEFLQGILRWLPEERPTAEELLFDPWLMEGLRIRGNYLAQEILFPSRSRDLALENDKTRFLSRSIYDQANDDDAVAGVLVIGPGIIP